MVPRNNRTVTREPVSSTRGSAHPRFSPWRVGSLLMAVMVGAAVFLTTEDAPARQTVIARTHPTDPVPLTSLPEQAQEVHRRIHAGGPFHYQKDGTVFGNRERRLPRQTRGYYREYTVPTPGARDRGARRIVCGGDIVRQPETCYYTADHYSSFRMIDPRQ